MAKNIFTALSKYKIPEDFMTAGFLYILEYLWRQNGKHCCEVLHKLCEVEVSPSERVEFKIHPHYSKKEGGGHEGGTPDFQIQSPGKLIWVEVKDRSALKPGQLKEYRRKLDKISEENGFTTRLVLLRHLFVDPEEAKYADVRVHWFEVYEWLDDLKSTLKDDADSTGAYLLEQFSEFLKQKGVPIMNKVGKDDLNKCFVQLESLMNMSKQAIEKQLNVKAKTYFEHCDDGSYSIGFHFKKKTYYVEFWLNEPDKINLSMDKEKLKTVEKRQIDEVKLKNNGRLEQDAWAVYANRPLATVFIASKKDQLKKIAGLLQEMYLDLDSVKKQYRKRN